MQVDRRPLSLGDFTLHKIATPVEMTGDFLLSLTLNRRFVADYLDLSHPGISEQDQTSAAP